jgi:hypothetical protein
MSESNFIELAVMDVLKGHKIFRMIKEEIDDFIKKYSVSEWLTLNQVAAIHEILMEGDRDKTEKRLEGYKELQLRRTSEKDRWQREVEGKKAIEYFHEMIDSLLDRHITVIKEEIEERFRFTLDDTYLPLIYQNLIKTFDHIFVTMIRILNDKEGSKCLKG